jgi:ribonuclease BN (tRNA processing enzyme)
MLVWSHLHTDHFNGLSIKAIVWFQLQCIGLVYGQFLQFGMVLHGSDIYISNEDLFGGHSDIV